MDKTIHIKKCILMIKDSSTFDRLTFATFRVCHAEPTGLQIATALDVRVASQCTLLYIQFWQDETATESYH